MTAEEMLHSVDFYERSEWESDEYPATIDGYQYDGRMHIPEIGELVEFGWQTRNGERVDELSEKEHYQFDPDSDVETGYERSDEYRVIDVKTHYHRPKVRKSTRELIVNRLELTTDVIVEPVESAHDQHEDE